MLSVIVPNYNRAALIGETLDNLLRQTRAPDELIVVDDGSTDDSVREIERFGSRVTLIRQTNAGPAAARNRGLAASGGALIQFFDSDDLCSLNKLELQAWALETTGADIAYGPWLQARLQDSGAAYAEQPLQQGPLPASHSAAAWMLRGWVIVLQCCLIRRSLLERTGPYRTDLLLGEDGELLMRLLLAGARLVHVPEALTLYRMHAGAQLSRGALDDRRHAAERLRFVEAVSQLVAGDAPGIGAADRAAWQRTLLAARRDCARLCVPDDHPARRGGETPPGAPLLHARQTLERWRAGAALRLTGSRAPRPFRPGPLTAAQRDQLRAIGYEPVRDPRVQG